MADKPGHYRYAEYDVERVETLYDFVFTAKRAYIVQKTSTGHFVTGINGAPTRMYAVDPESNTVTPIARVHPFANQSGYENHATADLAADMILAGRDD